MRSISLIVHFFFKQNRTLETHMRQSSFFSLCRDRMASSGEWRISIVDFGEYNILLEIGVEQEFFFSCFFAIAQLKQHMHPHCITMKHILNKNTNENCPLSLC